MQLFKFKTILCVIIRNLFKSTITKYVVEYLQILQVASERLDVGKENVTPFYTYKQSLNKYYKQD